MQKQVRTMGRSNSSTRSGHRYFVTGCASKAITANLPAGPGAVRAVLERLGRRPAVAPGFEPGRELPPYTLSRRAPSSARASHRVDCTEARAADTPSPSGAGAIPAPGCHRENEGDAVEQVMCRLAMPRDAWRLSRGPL